MALAGGACGERFEIGALGQELEPGGTETATIDAPLLAGGPEDADAIVDEALEPRAVGDVDGDGYGDWMSNRLAYGRPRPSDGVWTARLDEGPSFLPPGDPDGRRKVGACVGDFDGDGYDDLMFRSAAVHAPSAGDGRSEEERTADLAAISLAWAAQRAFLWYGGPDRSPGTLPLETAGVPLGGYDDLAGRFQSELRVPLGNDNTWYVAVQELDPAALGDVDGDGYADLGVSATFTWHLYGNEPVTRGERTESVSYVYYGRSQRLEVGATPEPDARLPGVTRLRSIGDVNGDGYADLQAVTAGGIYLLPGGAQRLSGELSSLDGRGVLLSNPMSPRLTAVGDFDRDGFDDLVLDLEQGDGGTRLALFYGSAQFFEQAVDESSASAIFSMPARLTRIEDIGDWNGDGANDMLLMHERLTTDIIMDPLLGAPAGLEVRLIPGGSARLSGKQELALPIEPGKAGRLLSGNATPAGDIDGDGKADLFFSVHADHGRTTKYVKYGRPLPSASIR